MKAKEKVIDCGVVVKIFVFLAPPALSPSRNCEVMAEVSVRVMVRVRDAGVPGCWESVPRLF